MPFCSFSVRGAPWPPMNVDSASVVRYANVILFHDLVQFKAIRTFLVL